MTNQANSTPSCGVFVASFLDLFAADPATLEALEVLSASLLGAIVPAGGDTIEQRTGLRLLLASRELLALAGWLDDLSRAETLDSLRASANHNAAVALSLAGDEAATLTAVAERIHRLAARPTAKVVTDTLAGSSRREVDSSPVSVAREALAEFAAHLESWNENLAAACDALPEDRNNAEAWTLRGLLGYLEKDTNETAIKAINDHLAKEKS